VGLDEISQGGDLLGWNAACVHGRHVPLGCVNDVRGRTFAAGSFFPEIVGDAFAL